VAPPPFVSCILILSKSLFTNWCATELL